MIGVTVSGILVGRMLGVTPGCTVFVGRRSVTVGRTVTTGTVVVGTVVGGTLVVGTEVKVSVADGCTCSVVGSAAMSSARCAVALPAACCAAAVWIVAVCVKGTPAL